MGGRRSALQPRAAPTTIDGDRETRAGERFARAPQRHAVEHGLRGRAQFARIVGHLQQRGKPGAVAGLVGLPAMLGDLHAYGQDLPKNKGFDGIAIALLGRNHPAGIVAAACLFGLLSATSGGLQIAGVPNSIIDIIQAITVLSVVIVNEAVTRKLANRTAQRAAAALELQGAAA